MSDLPETCGTCDKFLPHVGKFGVCMDAVENGYDRPTAADDSPPAWCPKRPTPEPETVGRLHAEETLARFMALAEEGIPRELTMYEYKRLCLLLDWAEEGCCYEEGDKSYWARPAWDGDGPAVQLRQERYPANTDGELRVVVSCFRENAARWLRDYLIGLDLGEFEEPEQENKNGNG